MQQHSSAPTASEGSAPSGPDGGPDNPGPVPRGERRLQASDLPSGKGERILLVDDEDTVRRVTQRLLEKLGYMVTSVPGGRDALKVLEETDELFDLVLTDVVMPGMTGIEMADRIRHMNPDQPILFTSGYTTREYGRAPGQPPQPFMPKPFSMADLAENVRKALHG